MDTTLQKALLLNAQGINVIPLKSFSKEPIENFGWKKFNYFKQTKNDINNLFANHTGNIATICGEVSGNLVVFDCDTDEAYNVVVAALRSSGAKIVKSARGGHVYIRTDLPAKSKVIKSSYGKIEVRSNGLYVVSEGSTHPNGTVYQILNDPAELPILKLGKIANLDFLVLEPDFHETGAAQILRESGLLDKLREGRYGSRSEADMALITFLIRKGYSKDHVGYFLVKAGHQSRYVELLGTNPGRATAWLDLSIKKASNLDNTDEFNLVKQQMEELKQIILKTPLPGKTGASLYKVILAHVNTCQNASKWNYHFSVREASEKGGISHITFMKRNKELMEKGIVINVEKNRGIEGNIYKIDSDNLKSFLSENSVQDFSSQSSIIVTNCESYGQLGMFERGSFGHSSNQIYNLVASSKGITLSNLIELTGRSRNTIKRALSAMEQHLLIEKKDKEYFITNKNIAEFAYEEGHLAKAVKRKQVHARERFAYRNGWK